MPPIIQKYSFLKLRDASSTKPAVLRRPRTEIFEQSCLLCQWQEGNLFGAYNHRHYNGSDNGNDGPRSCLESLPLSMARR